MEEVPIMTSMGMFIIDENKYPPSWNRKNETDIIGGGGPYAIVGGRIIAGKKYGRRVCGIIDQGNDFPSSIYDELSLWDSGIIFRKDLSRSTTRGKNIYTVDDIREFEYLGAKKQIVSDDIVSNPKLAKSASIHLLCSINRGLEFVNHIDLETDSEKIYIFEPLPSDCTLNSFSNLIKILPKIRIFTPNLDEASDLTGLPKTDLIGITKKFLQHLPSNGGVVLRCGPDGCYINTNDGIDPFILPAYHQDQNMVKDVTGGGNSFCGGFVTGFCLSNFDWKVAGICGNLASGCVIEKLGMPTYDKVKDTWTNMSVKNRLKIYANNNPSLEIDELKFSWI